MRNKNFLLALFFVATPVPRVLFGAGGMPQLAVETFASQVFWLVICFTVLYVIVQKKISPQISEVLNVRAHKITQDLHGAQTMNEEAEAIKETIEVTLKNSQSEVQQILNHNAEVIAKKNAVKLEKFQHNAVKKQKDFQKKLENVKQELENEIDKITPDICVAVSKKIGGVSVNKTEIKKYLS